MTTTQNHLLPMPHTIQSPGTPICFSRSLGKEGWTKIVLALIDTSHIGLGLSGFFC
jgi:hypothetical protein